jgi:hypothetical protein
MLQSLNANCVSQSQIIKPQFGAIYVNKDSIAKSGLGSEAAKDIQDLADRLNRSKDPNSPVKVLEDVGIDIWVRRSDNPDVVENDKQFKGNVTVDFKKRGQFEPAAPVTLHSFQNEYDTQDKNGNGFLARIYEEASFGIIK